MWLPIIGFCDGVAYNEVYSSPIDNKEFLVSSPFKLYRVRNVSVKVAKAGRNWYDGYTFEVRVVIDNNMNVMSNHEFSRGHIMTFIPYNGIEYNHGCPIIPVKTYIWGNHANYTCRRLEIKYGECNERYVHIFSGVQITPPICGYNDLRKLDISSMCCNDYN